MHGLDIADTAGMRKAGNDAGVDFIVSDYRIAASSDVVGKLPHAVIKWCRTNVRLTLGLMIGWRS